VAGSAPRTESGVKARRGATFDATHERLNGRGGRTSAPRKGASNQIPGNRREDYPDPDTLPGEPPGTGAAVRRPNPAGARRRKAATSTARRRTRKVSVAHPTGGRTVTGIAHDGAGVILGMVVYALILSVVQYGPTGPVLWFKAKFLNQAAGAPGSSSSSSSATTTPAAPTQRQLNTIRPGRSGKAS
jgi:hypothetical protein